MPVPPMGEALVQHMRAAAPLDRARFIARQRATGMKWDAIGELLGISAQRAGQLLKRYGYDEEIAALRDVGSAIQLHRKGITALAELVDLGIGIAHEAATDPAVERKEKAAIVAAAVGPAHRLVEAAEKVLKRHQIGAIEQAKATFDHHALLDAVALAVDRINTLPPEAQPVARDAMRAAIHGKGQERPVIDVEALEPAAVANGDAAPITPF